MTDTLKAFRGAPYQISDGVVVHQPTLDQIAEYGEQKYFNLIYFLCATPADRKVELWDTLHIFWEEMDEYQLFVSSLGAFTQDDTKIILPDLDLASFSIYIAPDSGDIILRNKEGVTLDRKGYLDLTDYLRSVHLMTKNVDIGADNTTRKVMIDVSRSDQEAAARKQYESVIIPFASVMMMQQPLNQIFDLPIGAFMHGMGRALKVKDYDHMMQGIYSGCIDIKKINKKDLNWLGKLK